VFSFCLPISFQAQGAMLEHPPGVTKNVMLNSASSVNKSKSGVATIRASQVKVLNTPIAKSCKEKYESSLQSLLGGHSVSLVASVPLDNSAGVYVGEAKCGCNPGFTAYISRFSETGEIFVGCFDSTMTISANSGGWSSPDGLANNDEKAWCDNCFEKEIVDQISGTCGCPVGYTATFDGDTLRCTGTDGNVVTRQDKMDVTSSLKYLADFDSSYYSQGDAVLKKSLKLMSVTSPTLVAGANESLYQTVKSVYLSLDVEACKSSLTDSSSTLTAEQLEAAKGGYPVVNKEGKCVYRTPAGTELEVSENYQLACKRVAQEDTSASKSGKIQLTTSKSSLLSTPLLKASH